MKVRRNMLWTAFALLAVIALLGACNPPAPQEPVGAVSDQTHETMWVTKEFTSEGTNTFSGTILGATPLVFEGATDNAYETTFAITDPASSDKTITFPNSTGTVALNPYGASIEFEGATADDFETTLTVVDPTTPDKTITLPNETGAVMMSSLATNGTGLANSVTGGTNSLIWEGSGVDAFEMTVSATNPTAARSVVLPDAGGTVMLSALATNGADAANSVTGVSNGLAFEGATGANTFQTTVTVVDPTADNTVTIPNETGAVMMSSLATNGTDVANSVTGGSNALIFEGSGVDTYETTVSATNPTADRTVTLQDATGTVALTSQATDMTLTPAAANGNGALKNEYSGLPRIAFAGVGAGTNASLSVHYLDDDPTGECAPVDASNTEAEGSVAGIFRYGASSYESLFTAGSTEDDGFLCTIGSVTFETVENAGMWVYPTVSIASGDLQFVTTDAPTGPVKFSLGAMTANTWNWVEVDISALNAGTGDAVTGLGITLTAQGEGALGAFNLYVDRFTKWLTADSDHLGIDVLQDGVLSVANTTGGATLVEDTDYFVRYITGHDEIVYMTNQSAATSVIALVAY